MALSRCLPRRKCGQEDEIARVPAGEAAAGSERRSDTSMWDSGSLGPTLGSSGARVSDVATPALAPPPDHSGLLFHVKQFVSDLRSLSCQMAVLQGNGEERAGAPARSAVRLSAGRASAPPLSPAPQARRGPAAPSTGWSTRAAATGSPAPGSPGRTRTGTASWRARTWWSSTPGRSR